VTGERAEKEALLRQLWKFYRCGALDLYFGDESAFSMNPKLPYGWSPPGERIQIFPMRDKKINLFGIFRPDNFCVTYQSEANINSDFLICAINDFCRYIEKPTVLVLDNAPTHRLCSIGQQSFRQKWKNGWRRSCMFSFCRNIHRI